MDENPNPDLVVINLQNIFDGESHNDPEKLITSWSSLILSNLVRLDEDDPFILMKAKEYFGCVTLILAKEPLKARISKVSYDTIKFGLRCCFDKAFH